jgi:hypothetical protein
MLQIPIESARRMFIRVRRDRIIRREVERIIKEQAVNLALYGTTHPKHDE